jgi:hypothetical protein
MSIGGAAPGLKQQPVMLCCICCAVLCRHNDHCMSTGKGVADPPCAEFLQRAGGPGCGPGRGGPTCGDRVATFIISLKWVEGFVAGWFHVVWGLNIVAAGRVCIAGHVASDGGRTQACCRAADGSL